MRNFSLHNSQILNARCLSNCPSFLSTCLLFVTVVLECTKLVHYSTHRTRYNRHRSTLLFRNHSRWRYRKVEPRPLKRELTSMHRYIDFSGLLKLCPVRYGLRSSNEIQLVEPVVRLNGYGRRTFGFVGPRLWNALPSAVHEASSVGSFQQKLKTYLLSIACNAHTAL